MVMYVITHKQFNYQNLPNGYVPLLVGANKNANPDHFLQDNKGDNISDKNGSYCELTGLYWMWKHGENTNIGLSHYRRYFADYSSRNHMYLKYLFSGNIAPISVTKLDQDLDDGYDWIVTEPDYGGEGTLWDQYNTNHHIKDLNITREVIKQYYPEYLSAFDHVMKHTQKGSFYNMFYTSKDELNSYARWLFDVLTKVEERTDVSSYDSYQSRLYGFLGERLLNIWLYKRKAKIKYYPVYQSEEMSRTRALRACLHFLKTKL